MAAIVLEAVGKRFPGGHHAVRDVTLEIPHGELTVLVGPSGSGKSTTLRLIAGLEAPTSGRILIGDRDVTDVPPQERDLAMVFQSYALYPHKTVRENLAFGLKVRGTPRTEIARRVQDVATALRIESLLDRRPAQLSGGQRQRVALGRAIVREPQAFLLDEPLSNLDPALRLDTRAELALMHRRLGATMVYVTHDQEEAMKLGERIVVMRDGAVEQAASPLEIYRRPATLFVATFVGSPPMNVFTGEIVTASAEALAPGSPGARHGEGRRATAARFHGADFELSPVREAPLQPRRHVSLGIRPQDVAIAGPAAAGTDARARVEVVETIGSEVHVHARLASGARCLAVAPPDSSVRPDDEVSLRFRTDRLHLFDDGGTRI